MGYLGNAWKAYMEHFGLLALLGIASVFLPILLARVPLGSTINPYLALFLMIAAYKAIEGKIEWKDAAVQAIWAWIAQLLVEIGIFVGAIISILIAAIIGAANVAAGIAVGIILVTAVLTVALRFIFIPYFAHRGYDLGSIISKSWERGWGPAIVAGLEVFLVWLIGGVLATIIAFPAIKATILSVISTMKSASPLMAKAHIESTVLQSAWATITAPQNLGFIIAALTVFGIIAPLAWLVIYFGGKEGEADVENSGEDM
jgi:hypothetical protein